MNSVDYDSFEPLVEPLVGISSVEAFQKLARLPHVLFLDSAQREKQLGRYAFVMADPIVWKIQPSQDGVDGFSELDEMLMSHRTRRVEGLPPFQGGLAGMFAYDLGRGLECLPHARFDEFQIPALAVGLYDVVLAFDLFEEKGWIISQGLQESDPAKRRCRAESRLKQFQDVLSLNALTSLEPRTTHPALSANMLAPQHAVGQLLELTSNFSANGYVEAIEKAIEYIHAGDIFQVNMSQRLLYPAKTDSLSFYLRLRERNPAPFAAYMDIGAFQIASASPERFVRMQDRVIETRPIKGTRPRRHRPEADLFSGSELQQSAKDRSENVMIVDLLRNDLSRVCDAESVQVSALCELETYAYVQHLVSTVTGKLRAKHTPIDLLRATFPGGSITGAPKIRAMEIIAALEPTSRGPYCGSIGYISLDGSMDTNILIRTITAGKGWWQFPVGGGIVANSRPQMEYEETWHKAEGLLRSLLP